MSDHIIQSPLNTVWASLYSHSLWSLGSEGGRWHDWGPGLCLCHEEPAHLVPGLGTPSNQYFHHYFHPWLADDSLSNFQDHKRLWRLLVAAHARGCHTFHSSFYTHQSIAEFSSALVCGDQKRWEALTGKVRSPGPESDTAGSGPSSYFMMCDLDWSFYPSESPSPHWKCGKILKHTSHVYTE